MESVTCPECGADLDADLIASRGDADCPFCGADVAELFAESPGETAPATSPRAGVASGTILPPQGSRIEIVESGDDRLVIAIPPGGKSARGIGWFALFWNGFLAVFTGVWVGVGLGAFGDAELLALLPLLFVSLFWLIGLGIAYAWVRMAFMTTYLLLEPHRLVVQRVLFGRKTTRETAFGDDFSVRLEESYSQNDVPVHEVVVRGRDRTEKFGTRLDESEKQWLVRRISWFVTGGELPEAGPGGLAETVATGLDASRPTESVEPLSPDRLPGSSTVVVEPTPVDRLRFHLPLVPPGGIRTGIGCVFGGFAAIWLAMTLGVATLSFVKEGEIVGATIALGVGLFGLIPLLFAVAVRRARISVEIDDERLTARWHAGPLGPKKSVPLTSITSVGVGTAMTSERRGRRTSSAKCCLVKAAGSTFPLTTFHDLGEARTVAGLVTHELERRGVTLQDV